jgi:LuxR family maltose regulon positive regulatory protein
MTSPLASLALLVAPAGYGKTTLLSEWDSRDERPFGWVTLDEGDNDPERLLEHIACALDSIEPSRLDVFEALSEMEAHVLVLDDAHVLHRPAALATLSAITQVLGPESQLALASRSDPGLPVGRLRAHRDIVELRTRDLAMTTPEAHALFAAAAVNARPDDVRALMQRTEGWPAGLYLAALAVGEHSDIHAGVARFAGDDRYVADYLRDEFLSDLTDGQLAFLTRTSVLEELSGEACDAILDARGSAATLALLARSNLLLVSLDHNDECYRCNPLLAEMLRAELHRLGPDREADLHRRASRWFESHGDTDRAMHHAVQAHDVDGAGDMMWRHISRYLASGRDETVQRWLANFSEDEIAACPSLALTAANSCLAAGDGNRVEHWTSLAAGALAHAPRARKEGLRAGVAVMRACIARDGIARMAADAARAYELEADGGAWHPLCRLLEGVALHLRGDRTQAQASLELGMRGAAVQAPNVHALCLTQLALLALDEDDSQSAAWLAARGKAVVKRSGLAHSPTAALVFAVSAAVRAHGGQVEEAAADRVHALKLLAGLIDFVPWYEVEARIALARASLRLSDPVSARGLLAEASRILRQTPDAAVLREWLDEVWAQADASEGASSNGGWTLTTAELRVLQFLPSHLSFPKIAERLYVSPNTVKTHVRAVYRKLDASSRGQAVERARDSGLLDLNQAG